MHRHMWEDKGAEMLRVIQLNTLEDRAVHDKHQWDSAINFLEASLREKLENSEANLRDQVGPGFYEKWFKWQNVTDEQSRKASVLYELERLLRADDDHKAHLSFEELTTIKVNLKNLLELKNQFCFWWYFQRNLQTNSGIEVDNEIIRETWHPVYRRHFLQKAIKRCNDCRRGFFMYSKGIENDVIKLINVLITP